MLLALSLAFFVGVAFGIGAAGANIIRARTDFDPGIGHPGMTCREARIRIEELQQDVLLAREGMEAE